MTTSQEAYEAAAERYAAAYAAWRTARQVSELASIELEAAADALAEHETSPGLPSYAHGERA